MGYTHYWYQNEIPQENFDKLRSATSALLELVSLGEIKLGDAFGKPGSYPLVDKDKIVFNGQEPDDYETFYMERAPSSESNHSSNNEYKSFSFCKTQYRPYDPVVIAVLCLADLYCGEYINVSSDGGAEDWVEGLELARSIRAEANIPQGVRER